MEEHGSYGASARLDSLIRVAIEDFTSDAPTLSSMVSVEENAKLWRRLQTVPCRS